MKQSLCFSLLMSLVCSSAYSAAPKASLALEVQKSVALPTHLTTRIQWSNFPQLRYKNEDLKDQNRTAIIRVYADETGKVSNASVQESTGLAALDQLLIQAVRAAQVKPYIENDTAVPLIGYQAFGLKLHPESDNENCLYAFDSKNWQAQQQQQKTAFTYRNQPVLEVNTEQLNGHNRAVKFTFKTNKQGDVKKVKIKQGSGIYALDQQILQALSHAEVDVPRKWLYKKSKLKDEINFDLQQCQ